MDLLTKAVAAPFEAGSAVRSARIFHPRGVLFDGTARLEEDRWPDAAPDTVPIQARLSRGIGLPQPLPDVLGLAVRVQLPGGPWDLLLASSYVPARVVLAPARSWASARYSTLAGYRRARERSPFWFFAVPEGRQPDHRAAIADLAPPLSFAVFLARAGGRPVPAGVFQLERRVPRDDDAQPSFDPVLNRPQEVAMWPAWLATMRRAAYAGSRRGRGGAVQSEHLS